MPPSVDKRVPFQQVTIEYRVVGDFDGLTLAPNVVLDPTSPDFNEADERGIHVVDVQGNLGLIDPDLIGAAAQGDRCIPWVYLDTQGVGGAAGSLISVLDNVQRNQGVPVPTEQRSKFFTGGVPLFYAERPTGIPQGSVLGIIGYGGGSMKIFRINIVAPQDALEFAAILEACCCADVECEDPPTVTGFDSQTVVFFPGASQVTVDGTNLDRGGVGVDLVFVQVCDSLQEPETGGTVGAIFNNGNDFQAVYDVNPGANTPAGKYQATVFDPQDPSCNNAQQANPPTIIFWPAGCPYVTDPQAGAPFNTPEGGPTLVPITGQNFGTNLNPNIASVRMVSQQDGDDLSSVGFDVVDDNNMNVTVDPSDPPDAFGLYDMVVTPVDLSCPEQKILGVINVT